MVTKLHKTFRKPLLLEILSVSCLVQKPLSVVVHGHVLSPVLYFLFLLLQFCSIFKIFINFFLHLFKSSESVIIFPTSCFIMKSYGVLFCSVVIYF